MSSNKLVSRVNLFRSTGGHLKEYIALTGFKFPAQQSINYWGGQTQSFETKHLLFSDYYVFDTRSMMQNLDSARKIQPLNSGVMQHHCHFAINVKLYNDNLPFNSVNENIIFR